MLPRGKSSGPITFMKLYDAVGESTKSGGRVRRASILCSMPVWHPDIFNFIKCKEEDGRLANMNISVSITDKFIESLENNIPFDLVTPYNGKKIDEIDPHEIWNSIASMAWKTADPGVFFIDTVNKYNPLISEILIETSNPCIVGNTKIMTDKGEIEVKSLLINIDDYKVATYNIESKEIEWESIVWGDKTREHTDVIKVEFDDDSFIELTPDHMIYTENRGYVKAVELNEEDTIVKVL